MPPKAGLDRPLPRTDREFRNRQSELRAEFLAEKVRPAIAVILLEHKRIGERSGELRILRLAGKLRQRLHRVVMRVRRAAIGGEVEMPEADMGWHRELVGVLRVPALEFGGRRFPRGSVFCAMRRLTISSSLSRPIASASRYSTSVCTLVSIRRSSSGAVGSRFHCD